MLILAAALALTPPACTAAEATATNVQAIAAAPEQWLDQCVRVDGVVTFRQLYADRHSIYRIGYDRRGPGAREGLEIGLDQWGVEGAERWRWALIPSRVVGTVDSCERRNERLEARARASREPAIVVLGGYCHSSGGPVIVATQVELTGEPVQRLKGEVRRARYGDIVPMPASWRDRAEAEQIARAVAIASANGDVEALARLLVTEKSSEGVTVLSAGRRRPTPPQVALFISRYRADQGSRSPAGYEAIGCVCRTADCTDLWPLAQVDADAGPERPYACFNIERGDWPGAAAQVSVSTRSWLAEPR